MKKKLAWGLLSAIVFAVLTATGCEDSDSGGAVHVEPASLVFVAQPGANPAPASIEVIVVDTGTAAVPMGVSADRSWIHVDPSPVQGSLGTISVDAAALGQGTFTGGLDVHDAGGRLVARVPVRMRRSFAFGRCAHAFRQIARMATSLVTRLVIGFRPVLGTRDLVFSQAIRRFQCWRG